MSFPRVGHPGKPAKGFVGVCQYIVDAVGSCASPTRLPCGCSVGERTDDLTGRLSSVIESDAQCVCAQVVAVSLDRCQYSTPQPHVDRRSYARDLNALTIVDALNRVTVSECGFGE